MSNLGVLLLEDNVLISCGNIPTIRPIYPIVHVEDHTQSICTRWNHEQCLVD
jgi:hypothetical protein